MRDASVSSGLSYAAPWLLLILQLPPTPSYLRVKTRRRLKRIGAAPVKHTVYLLPNDPESLEDFQWLRAEIEAEGGSAIVAEATFVDGLGDEEIAALLEAERQGAEPESAARPASERVESGRTWVTRAGVFVDRIACAWLIRRAIDPGANFKFVAARGYKPLAGELRFDMVGGEYTHVGDACSFQTLCARFGITDPALLAVGEVVHDIDCKDEKYARPETQGISGLLRGIADATDDDTERLARGGRVFDELYAFYSSKRTRRG
jgi:hypothetical protein